MPSLNDALALTHRHAQVQQLALNNAGANIAQANVPNSQRTDLRLGAGGLDHPVLTAVPERASDPLAEGVVLAKRGEAAFYGARSDMLRAQLGVQITALGDADLGHALGDFFAAWRHVVLEPANVALRQNVLSATDQLAERLRLVASDVVAQRQRLDAQVAPRLVQANTYIAEIADLNGAISNALAANQPTNLLEDRRGQAAATLAREVGATVIYDDDGSMRPLLANTISLVGGSQAYPLTTRVDPLSSMHHVVVAATVDTTIDHWLASGELGAVVRMRDDDLPAALTGLDQFAFDLATAVNTQHNAGFGLDGVGARGLFATVPALPAGFGQTIALDPAIAAQPAQVAAAAVAANLPAEADNARLIIALEGQQVAAAGTLTLSDSLTALTGELGTNIARATTRHSRAQSELTAAETILQQRVGINIQEQLVAAQQARDALAAGMKIVGHIDSMLQALLAVR